MTHDTLEFSTPRRFANFVKTLRGTVELHGLRPKSRTSRWRAHPPKTLSVEVHLDEMQARGWEVTRWRRLRFDTPAVEWVSSTPDELPATGSLSAHGRYGLLELRAPNLVVGARSWRVTELAPAIHPVRPFYWAGGTMMLGGPAPSAAEWLELCREAGAETMWVGPDGRPVPLSQMPPDFASDDYGFTGGFSLFLWPPNLRRPVEIRPRVVPDRSGRVTVSVYSTGEEDLSERVREVLLGLEGLRVRSGNIEVSGGEWLHYLRSGTLERGRSARPRSWRSPRLPGNVLRLPAGG